MKILFVCIGNINRSRAAEAILKSKQFDEVEVRSRGLLPKTAGRPMSPDMFACLSPEEQKFVSPAAEPLELSDIAWCDTLIIFDYYVKDLLRTRFSELYWKDKVKFFTQDSKTFEPFIPIKDPHLTKDYKACYDDIKKYFENIYSGILAEKIPFDTANSKFLDTEYRDYFKDRAFRRGTAISNFMWPSLHGILNNYCGNWSYFDIFDPYTEGGYMYHTDKIHFVKSNKEVFEKMDLGVLNRILKVYKHLSPFLGRTLVYIYMALTLKSEGVNFPLFLPRCSTPFMAYFDLLTDNVTHRYTPLHSEKIMFYMFQHAYKYNYSLDATASIYYHAFEELLHLNLSDKTPPGVIQKGNELAQFTQELPYFGENSISHVCQLEDGTHVMNDGTQWLPLTFDALLNNNFIKLPVDATYIWCFKDFSEKIDILPFEDVISQLDIIFEE